EDVSGGGIGRSAGLVGIGCRGGGVVELGGVCANATVANNVLTAAVHSDVVSLFMTIQSVARQIRSVQPEPRGPRVRQEGERRRAAKTRQVGRPGRQVRSLSDLPTAFLPPAFLAIRLLADLVGPLFSPAPKCGIAAASGVIGVTCANAVISAAKC